MHNISCYSQSNSDDDFHNHHVTADTRLHRIAYVGTLSDTVFNMVRRTLNDAILMYCQTGRNGQGYL